MDRAVKFHGETLGLTVKQSSEDWSETAAGGLMIGLNAREQTAPSGSSGGAAISFQPDGGIDDEVNRSRNGGVGFIGEISDHRWGRIAPFKDSEGNDLQFYAPPA